MWYCGIWCLHVKCEYATRLYNNVSFCQWYSVRSKFISVSHPAKSANSGYFRNISPAKIVTFLLNAEIVLTQNIRIPINILPSESCDHWILQQFQRLKKYATQVHIREMKHPQIHSMWFAYKIRVYFTIESRNN